MMADETQTGTVAKGEQTMIAFQPQSTAVIQTAGQGKTFSFLGATAVLRATGGETGGTFGIAELTLPPHFRHIAPHWHAHTTESFYVLDGTIAFTLDDRTFTLGRGGFVMAPARTVHQFWNPTAAPATLLDLFLPGGFEAYFEELAATFPTNARFDAVRMAEIGTKYGQFAPLP